MLTSLHCPLTTPKISLFVNLSVRCLSFTAVTVMLLAVKQEKVSGIAGYQSKMCRSEDIQLKLLYTVVQEVDAPHNQLVSEVTCVTSSPRSSATLRHRSHEKLPFCYPCTLLYEQIGRAELQSKECNNSPKKRSCCYNSGVGLQTLVDGFCKSSSAHRMQGHALI